MAQINAPLALKNGAATPVAKSFAPERVSPELSVFTERSAGMSAGFPRITAGYSAANSRRPTSRVDLSLDLPVLGTVGGVTSVANVGRFKGYFVIPDTMDAANRADLHAYVVSLVSDALVLNMVRNLDPAY